MNRYIDLEDFNNNFRGELCKGIDCDTCTFHRGSYFCKLADYINNYQIADVAPVIHAQWRGIKYLDGLDGFFGECGNCGMLGEVALYCMHCGAKMDEEV